MDAASHSVFVYGTLQSDAVLSILLNRLPSSSPAFLHGFHRFSIKGRVYPAILPVRGKQVQGKVLTGLTTPELDILDAFEDEEYVRNLVEVSLLENSKKLPVLAYVWGDKDDPDLYGGWNFEEWEQVHLDEYVKMTKEFMKELNQGGNLRIP